MSESKALELAKLNTLELDDWKTLTEKALKNQNPEAIQTLMNIYGTIGDNVGYMKMKKLLE